MYPAQTAHIFDLPEASAALIGSFLCHHDAYPFGSSYDFETFVRT